MALFRWTSLTEETDCAEVEAESTRKVTFMVRREVKRRLEEGRAFMDVGKVDDALECYRAALGEDPSCALSHFNMGYALHEKGLYDAARDAYRKAVELEPTCSLFLENLARLQFDMLDYQEAARHYYRAALVGPIQSISLGLWGRALFEQGLYEQAVETFESLLERQQPPDIVVGARYWLAVAHAKLGRLAAARRMAEAILAEPNIDPKILSELGEHFVEARCLSLAHALFERLTQQKEEMLSARLRLEDIRNIEHQIDEALPRLFDGDEERLLHQIHSMREFGCDRVSKALLSLIDSPSAPVRESIVRYQTAFGYDVSEKVLPLLKDEVPYVREAAYDYFEKLDRGDYIKQIALGLRDHSPEIRARAARLLGRFSAIELLPELEMMIGDPLSRSCKKEFREAIASIKRRYQKKQDTLYQMKAYTVKTTNDGFPSPRDFRFWILVSVQMAFVAYFIYYLFFRV